MLADFWPIRPIIIFLVAFILGLFGGSGLANANNDMVAGEYIIKFKPGLDSQTKSKIISQHALEKRKDLNIIDAQVVTSSNSLQAQSQSSLLDDMAKDPSIEYIEPNYRLYPVGTPISQDTGASFLWGLKNYGQTINGSSGITGIDINLEPAWLITSGNPNLLIAVIDTGVEITHPDLLNAVWTNTDEIAGNGIDDDGNGFIDDTNGWDFLNDDNSVYDSESIDDHGTHCAGTIAATRNDVGVVGVAPGVKILPLKFLDTEGGDTSDAIAAIEYAAQAGARIVNCSWGGADNSLALRDTMATSEMLFIAAAGNADSNMLPCDIDINPLYPASFDLPNIITVAAIDNRGNLASFSYYGYNSVDVAAPGEAIYSTLPGNTYGFMQGTSMATPHVSGIAALIASSGITDISVIKQRILDSARQHALITLSGKVLTGGLVDATWAVQENLPPTVSDLSVIGTLYPGEIIRCAYTYDDVNQDPEGISLLQWYRTDSVLKNNVMEITGATSSRYTLTVDDIGMYIFFKATPVATSGVTPGIPVFCESVGPVKAGPLIDLQLLDETTNLLSSFSPAQISYDLTVDPSLSLLQLNYNVAENSTISIYFDDVLINGNKISLNGKGGTISFLVQTPGIVDRCYLINISQPVIDNCFIATAAFGSKYAPAVKMLRLFRDEYLLTNEFGRILVAFYYHYSPPIANYIADRTEMKILTRILLSPFVLAVYLLYHKWLLFLSIFICIIITLVPVRKHNFVKIV